MSSTAQVEGIRTVDGIEVPAPGTYVFDDTHTSIEFVGRHMMVTKVRGRFDDFTGHVVIGEDPFDSSAEVAIKAASLNTRNEQRDGHLRSPDFLDTETFPTIDFKTDSLTHVEGRKWKATGTLTVKDVSKPVTMDVEFGGSAKAPWGPTPIFFSGSVEFDREDFGMTWNQALEAGGWLVGKKVRIEIETEALPQEDEAAA